MYTCSTGKGESIPFDKKPAQQLLSGLGCNQGDNARNMPLSSTADGKPLAQENNKDITIQSFDQDKPGTLTIPGARLDRLLNSAKVYVNTDIIKPGLYNQAVQGKQVKAQDDQISEDANLHWLNMAVGVCHVQEIDLLVKQQVVDGKAISVPKEGKIGVDDPGILLLSSPALNFMTKGRALSQEQTSQLLTGMYHNIFSAAVAEGATHITMPAAGLGVFGGEPEVYFKILMDVARQYPNLNVIYHPGHPNNIPFFNEAMKQAGEPPNVIRASKDVMYIADELAQQGIKCAFHNPSDADVVYGVYDVGEYWKNGRGAGFVGEEFIGVSTTAVLNSNGLNPSAYKNVVERNFGLPVTPGTDLNSREEKAFTNVISQTKSPELQKLDQLEAKFNDPRLNKLGKGWFGRKTPETVKEVRKMIAEFKAEHRGTTPDPKKVQELLNKIDATVDASLQKSKSTRAKETTSFYKAQLADLRVVQDPKPEPKNEQGREIKLN
ncbi:hypothetical protein ACFORL_02560 [Legionella dresdenensis]|uniref:Uncharacterized protein n=1 Tax=Legionella dresdenensis TaxID=450200 RepID=A0ABV8CCF2_9GAMM